MLATAPSSDFTPFIRKIGYSVGLEFLLDRVRAFGVAYGEAEVFGYGDVVRLVQHDWRLKTLNVLDVLRSLGVVSVKNGEVAVLEVGDALGVAWRDRDTIDYESASAFYLTHAIVSADGDIFLNALASGFDEEGFRQNIERMIEHKWSILEDRFSTADLRKRFYKAVNIELQSNNSGSRGGQGRGLGLPPMGAPLGQGPLSGPVSRPAIQLSGDYLRKTLVTRRAWALALGLADVTGNPTNQGRQLLDAISDVGFGGPSCIAMWPLDHEIDATGIGSGSYYPRLDSWSFMVVIARGMGLIDEPVPWEPGVHERAIRDIERWFSLYWSINQSKRMVRNQMLGRVLYRLEIANSLGRAPLPLPAVFDREMEADSPRLTARRSREAELAIALR